MSTIFSRRRFPAIVILSLWCAGLVAQPRPETIPGKFVVKIRSNLTLPENLSSDKTGIQSLDNALKSFPVRQVKRFCPKQSDIDPRGLYRVLELTLDPNIDADQVASRLRSLGDIEYAEPRYVRTVSFLPGKRMGNSAPMGGDELPNDPYFPLQWWLPYINAPAAWDVEMGDPSVVIADVDLGVDLDHPDLAPLLWRNALEYNGLPGVDDDGNGWVDDIYGWDFVDNDPNPRPENGDYHGTHTAGIAIAATNNGIGGAGVARNCRLMAVRTGTGESIYYGYEGIYYAAHTGAKVITLSWGGYGFSQFERDIVEDAQAQGCVLVAAAGNEAISYESYPAAFDAVIAVAALDQSGQKAYFSNWGLWVDICAPGVSILSTMPNGQWDYLSGTSMATPVVAGVGALVASLHPDYTSQQLAAAVIASGDPIDDANPMYGNRLGTGCVNAFRAVDGGRGGLELDSVRFDDSAGGNGDGIPDPGESIVLLIWLRNGLADEALVTGQLMEEVPGLTLLVNTCSFGAASSGATVTNISNPLEFTLDPALSRNQGIRLAMDLRDLSGRRLERIPIQFVLNPSYADHDVGNVRLTLTDFGAFGYLEYLLGATAEPRGSGFEFPKGSPSWLYHGSWVMGTDSSHVSDDCYGDARMSRRDFQVVPGGELSITSGGLSDQDGMAIFSDASATHPMGIRVIQRSYAWASPPDDDYVIVEADVQNLSATALSNLYIGLFLDWDVATYVNNRGGWEPTSGTGWMSNPTFPSPYVGLAVMDGTPASFRVIKNSEAIYSSGFPDSTKYRYLSQGIVIDQGTTNDDYSLLMSSGPYQLMPNEIVTVAYAVGGGNNLSDLSLNMAAARNRYYQTIPNSVRKPSPDIARWELLPIYPNPYNNLARIRLVSREASRISLDLYNVLGQKVSAIFQGPVGVGSYTFDIHDEALSSGIYFCRLQASGTMAAQKMTLIR